ncbi:T9SS type A sorting domain-containing protein [candidate division WOR-3 bacterium]|nr:T9SS type A sorting domain-containing protein [candidate division WOR-3 bacterium]
MKQVGVLILLPFLVFSLETVNLIKDHSFEKDSDLWNYYIGASIPTSDIPAFANRHDSEKAFDGIYSASCDTRTPLQNAPEQYTDSAVIIQGFTTEKVVGDLDSLIVRYAISPKDDIFYNALAISVALNLNPEGLIYWNMSYLIKNSDANPPAEPPKQYLEQMTIEEDTGWFELVKPIRYDLNGVGISDQTRVDSLVLDGYGAKIVFWFGQKVYFDDVRLMGYADYDVGVKEIFSGDLIQANTPYIPEARIKNFGREPADFIVVADIIEGETTIYTDTLDWSLSADTEDTVRFSECMLEPPIAETYTLRIHTYKDPDESDADDEKTKELHFSAIAEPPLTHPVTHLSLSVDPFSMSGVLRVSYSLPKDHTGALTLFDLSGRRLDAQQVRGYGSATFSSDLAAGVYIVRLEAGGTTLSRKVVVVR